MHLTAVISFTKKSGEDVGHLIIIRCSKRTDWELVFFSDFLSYMFHIINYLPIVRNFISRFEIFSRQAAAAAQRLGGRGGISNQSSDLANCSLTFKNNLGHRVPL